MNVTFRGGIPFSITLARWSVLLSLLGTTFARKLDWWMLIAWEDEKRRAIGGSVFLRNPCIAGRRFFREKYVEQKKREFQCMVCMAD